MEDPKLTFDKTMIILYSEEVLHISSRSMLRLCHFEHEPKY